MKHAFHGGWAVIARRPKNISSIRNGIVAKVTRPAEQPFRGSVTEAASYIIP